MMRWVIYAGLLALGFAGGALYFRADKGSQPGGGTTAGARSLRERMAAQPSGRPTAGGESPQDNIVAALKSKRGGLGSTMRAHLQLVEETPVADLPALLLSYEQSMPGASSVSVGSLVRDAIIERMIAENPTGLLEFALDGRSDGLKYHLQPILRGLRKQMSFEELEQRISSGEIPAVKMGVMRELLSLEIGENAERGWELALASGQVDFDRLAQDNPGPVVVEKLILADSPHRLSDRTIELCFGAMPVGNPAATQQKIDTIGQAGERIAAIRGFGSALGSSPEVLGGVADGLRSDQERLALYQGSFSTSVIEAPWAGEGLRSRYLDSVLAIDRPQVRQTLLDHQLRSWKTYAPDEARVWAEQHGQLELYESLQSVEFPVVPASFGLGGSIEAFVPPGVPSEFQQIPVDHDVDEN